MQWFVARRLAFLLTFSFSALSLLAQSPNASYESVNPFIGTANEGNTFPGATLPFGMIQWSPDTGSEAWYFHKDKQIYGFSLTHLSGAGCPVYGDYAVLPTTVELQASPGQSFAPYAVGFEHSHEEAHPGYYAVTLQNGVRAEITVSERSGIARFIFPAGSDARLLVNAGSSANTTGPDADKRPGASAYGNQIMLNGSDAFSGSTSAGGFCGPESHYKLYVSGHFDKPYTSSAVWQDASVISNAKSAAGKHTGAWLDFGKQHEVTLKVGISFVSEDDAEGNLKSEISSWEFEKVRAKARSTWTELLDRFAVQGGTSDQRTIFYTGVYHSFLAPTLFSDVDGNYIGFDGKTHSVLGSKQKAQYANFSDWDIYRNTVQLQALFDPDRESDMMQSLVNDAAQSGWLPRWPAANDVTYVMGGDSPSAVISSSYAFGAHNFDTDAALKFMVKAGTQPGKGPHNDAERPLIADYLKLGYLPSEKDARSASRTLEYSTDDFAIAQFAHTLGHEAVYHAFLKQAHDWKNLLDPQTKWIRPRASDGTWEQGFDADRSLPKRPNDPGSTDQDGFEEGNTYQYSFMVPFDYPELFATMGGDDKVIPRLDKFFSKLVCWGEPCFNMANEPDFVTPYAYVFAGQPWKTQDVVTRIEKETFNTTPDGIPGNDDLGATSGVYVWNALGFYPGVPGVGGLLIGTPMFEKATLHLAGNRTVVVSRKGSGIYVQDATVDGVAFPNSWLPLSKIHTGVTKVQFTMESKPNEQRGTSAGERPPAFH